MLKRAFALSDQGAKDLAKGIIAPACANLIQIIPASLLLMVVMMLLEKAAGTQVNVGRNIPFFVGITLVLFGMIAIAQLVQYNLTYTAAYKESANRRIVLAEKLRKLPLSFFEKKNLADLTTTIMGDCTALERTFVADGLFCREIDGLFCRSSPDIIVRRRCVLSHKRRGWLQPSPSFRYSRNLALQDELYHPVINNGPAVLVCVDKRLGTGPVNQSRDAG